MRIEYVVPCRYAEVNDGLATIVGAGIDSIAAAVFPTNVQVMLTVRILGQADEMPGAHRVRCPVRDSEDTTIAEDLDATIELPPEPAQPHPAGDAWLHNIMLAIGVAFVAPQAGTYTLNVIFDDAEYPVPIYLVQA